MGNKSDSFINRIAEIIVIFSSLLIVALMVTGGCNNGGHGGPSVTSTPTPTPALTGFPPECDGTFGVDLSCPATSLAGSFCQPYGCRILDSGDDPPSFVSNLHIIFGMKCMDLDCFTLECGDIFNGSVFDADTATIIVESVNGIPVSEDAMGVVGSGLPDGVIIIDGEEYLFDCDSIIVP